MIHSDFLDQKKRQSIIDWALAAQRSLIEDHQAKSAQTVSEAIRRYQENCFRIAVIGKVKRGKSTLINALLGRSDDLVAPVDKLPTSSAVSEFIRADQELATVHFRESGRKENIPFARIADYATEEKNPKNAKQVAGLSIQGPFPGLDSNVMLVDTPGAGSAHEHHDELLHAYIPSVDAVIFIITADMPIAADEEELLKALKNADVAKIFFAINRCDATEEQDIQDGIAHNLKILAKHGITPGAIHRISAKKAMQGDSDASGLSALSAEVRNYLATSRGDALDQRLIVTVKAQLSAAHDSRCLELESSSRSREEIETQIAKFHQDRTNIAAKCGIVEAAFALAWDKAVAKFESKLPEVKSKVETEVLANIDKTSVLSIDEAARKLPTTLMAAFEAHLSTPGTELENALKEAIQKLDAEYPFLEIRPDHGNQARLRREPYLIGSGVQSAAIFGVGMTMATVGSIVSAALGTAAATSGAAAAGVTGIAANCLAWLGMSGAANATAAAGTGIAGSLGMAGMAMTFVAPIGLLVAGLGLCVVPLAWRSSKLKQKGQLDDAARQQIDIMISQLRTVRIPELRQAKDEVIKAHQANIGLRLQGFEAALANAQKLRKDGVSLAKIETATANYAGLLERSPNIAGASY